MKTLDSNKRKYPGKIMLCGEYTVLNGGSSLLVPSAGYSGEWSYQKLKDSRLLTLLDTIKSDNNLESTIDIKAFELEINQGLTFQSNIPIGYGMGSSGALSAAIFDQFGIPKPINHQETREFLISIENIFHGTSSGMDALVSYLDKPIQVINQQIEILEYTQIIPSSLYVYDSGTTRNTSALVALYQNKINVAKNEKYLSQLKILNHDLTSYFKLQKQNMIQNTMALISEIQFKIFSPMIVQSIVAKWEYGLNTDKYYMKLCGAGGGGFYLVWVNDDSVITQNYHKI